MNVVTSAESLDALVERLSRWDGPIFLDTESSGLDPHSSRFLLLQLYFDDTVHVLDFTRMPLDGLMRLKPFLEKRREFIVAHNMIHDWKAIYHNSGIEMSPVHCTMVIEQVLKAGYYLSGFALADLALRRAGKELNKAIRNEFIGFTGGEITEEMLRYSADDVLVLEPIYRQQIEELAREQLNRVYNLETQLTPIVAMMEYEGICVDREHLERAIPIVTSLEQRALRAIQDVVIREGAADEILFSRDGYTAVNTASPKQMLETVNALRINVKSLGKKELSDWDNNWAIKNKRRNTLSTYAEDEDEDLHTGFSHPFLRQHAIRTAAAKLRGTYYQGILDRINPVTGRVHPGFKQCGAVATGRFSSTNPKLGL